MLPHLLTNPHLTLSALQFVSPLYLFALGAVALPVLAHLNRKKSCTTILFPAVRFLKQSITARKKSTRLRDLLLLLVRIAIIALIVLAFAQPIYKPGSSFSLTPVSNNQPGSFREFVIIIDASASMQRIDRGISLFDRAKLTAENLLTQISQSDNPSPIAIIIASGPQPRSLLPRFTGNITALRDLLRKQIPSFTRADLNQSLHLAASLPSPTVISPLANPPAKPPTRNRSAIIITDTQATEWSSISPQTIQNLFTDITILPITPANPLPNIAIRNLTITPPNPVVGDQVTISASTYYDLPTLPLSPKNTPSNSDKFSPQSLNMQINAGPYSINHAVENLQPGESRLMSMRFSFDEPQIYPVTITITPNDNFPADNEISTALRVRAKRRVLILTSPPQQSPPRQSPPTKSSSQNLPPSDTPTPATLLAIALQPYAQSPVTVSTRYLINDSTLSIYSNIQPITTSQLLNLFQTPDRPDIIALCAIDQLSETALATLDRLTRTGVSLLWFLDSPQSLNNWNRLEQLHHAQNNRTSPSSGKTPLPENALLPFIPDNWISSSSPSTLTTTDNSAFPFDDSLWSALFQTPFTPSALGSTTTTGKTLLQYKNNQPALITGRLGKGRILLFNASISLDKTPLAKQPIFIPFIHELIRYLMPTGNPFPQAEVGSPITISVKTSPTSNPPLLKNLTIKPDWAQQQCQLTNQPSPSQNTTTAPPTWSAYFDNPLSPTLITITDKKTNRLLAAAGIHINKSESQMRTLDNRELTQYIDRQTPAPSQTTTNQPQSSPPRTPPRNPPRKNAPFTLNTTADSPTPLWPTLLLLALLLAIVENIIQLTTKN